MPYTIVSGVNILTKAPICTVRPSSGADARADNKDDHLRARHGDDTTKHVGSLALECGAVSIG